MIPVEVLDQTWPILLVLLIVLVGSVLKVLASYHMHIIRRHDLVCESKRRRLEYEKAVMEQQGRVDVEM